MSVAMFQCVLWNCLIYRCLVVVCECFLLVSLDRNDCLRIALYIIASLFYIMYLYVVVSCDLLAFLIFCGDFSLRVKV